MAVTNVGNMTEDIEMLPLPLNTLEGSEEQEQEEETQEEVQDEEGVQDLEKRKPSRLVGVKTEKVSMH